MALYVSQGRYTWEHENWRNPKAGQGEGVKISGSLSLGHQGPGLGRSRGSVPLLPPSPGLARVKVLLRARHFSKLSLTEPLCGTLILFIVPREIKGTQLAWGRGLICTRTGWL